MLKLEQHFRYTTVSESLNRKYHPQDQTEYWLQWITPTLSKSTAETSDKISNSEKPPRYVRKFYRFIYDKPSSWNDISNDIFVHINQHNDSNKCFFEVIPGTWARRLYFDLDAPTTKNINPDELKSAVIDALCKWLHGKDINIKPSSPLIWVWSSCRPKKISFHIMLQYFYLLSHQHAKRAYLEILDLIPEPLREFVDPAVYSALQQWRIVGNIKRDTDPQYKKTLIHPLNSPYNEYLHSFAGMVDLKNDRLIDVILPVTSFNRVKHLNVKNSKRPTPSLKDDDVIAALDIFTSWYKLKSISAGRFDDTNQRSGLELTGYRYLSKREQIINLARIVGGTSFCHICLRDHYSENAYIYLNPYNGDIRFYCRRAYISNDVSINHTNEYVVIGKLPNFKEKMLPITIPPKVDISYENKYVDSLISHLQEHPTICIQSHMGTGKTTAIIEVIKHLAAAIEPPLRVIILGCRRMFCINMTSEYSKKSTIPFHNYLDMESRYYLGDVGCLAMQLESLHRTIKMEWDEILGVEPRDLVVMDESESFLAQFSSTTLIKPVPVSYAVSEIIRNSKYVIAADAFTSTRTQTFLSQLRPSLLTIQNTYLPPKRTAIYYKSFQAFKTKCLELYSLGGRLCVVCSSIKKITLLREIMKHIRTDEILLYTSDSSTKVKDTLKDVNTSWKNTGAVMFTSSITVGVNFDVMGVFDHLLIFFVHKTCTVRESFQSMARIRHFNESVIHFGISHIFPSKFNTGIKAYGDLDQIEEQIQQHRYFIASNHVELKEGKYDFAEKARQVEQLLKNEELPEFLISLHVYNTYERNATTDKFKKSIMHYFGLCNIEVQSADEKYDIAEEKLSADVITDLEGIPYLDDNIWINEEYDNLYEYLPTTGRIDKESFSSKYVCKILMKRQKYGLCSPLQKLALSKHCMCVLFLHDTPTDILTHVWEKYWEAKPKRFRQIQLMNLVAFMKHGSPYHPLNGEDMFLTLNDSMVRLQAIAYHIINLMPLYPHDLLLGKTLIATELQSTFDYLSNNIEEINKLLGINNSLHSDYTTTLKNKYKRMVETLDIDGIKMNYSRIFDELIANKPLTRLIKSLFSVEHIVLRHIRNNKLTDIEKLRVNCKQIFKETKGEIKYLDKNAYSMFDNFIAIPSNISFLDNLCVLREDSHDSNIFYAQLLKHIFTYVFNITIQIVTDRTGKERFVTFSSINIPIINFVSFICNKTSYQ